MSFSTRATVEFEPDNRSLRQLRSKVEDRVGSVAVNAQTDGGRNKPSFTDNRASRERAMTRNLLTLQLEKLGDIEEALTKQAFSDDGGSGAGTGILASLGLRGLVGGGSLGGLATLGGVGAAGAAGLGLMGANKEFGLLSNKQTGKFGAMGQPGLMGLSLGGGLGIDIGKKIGGAIGIDDESLNKAEKLITDAFSDPIGTLKDFSFPSLPKLELPTLPKIQFQKPGWISTIENFVSGGNRGGGNFGGSVIGSDGLPTAGGGNGLGNIDLSPNLNIDISLRDVRRQIEQAFRSVDLKKIVEEVVRQNFGTGFGTGGF